MKSKTVVAAAIAAALWCGAALGADDVDEKACPKVLQLRTVHQLMQAHVGGFNSGSARTLACNFDEDAVLVLPGRVAAGRQQIEGAYATLLQELGPGVEMHVTALTESDSVALMEYALTSGDQVVLRATDTFVAEHGFLKVEAHAAMTTGPLHTRGTRLATDQE